MRFCKLKARGKWLRCLKAIEIVDTVRKVERIHLMKDMIKNDAQIQYQEREIEKLRHLILVEFPNEKRIEKYLK